MYRRAPRISVSKRAVGLHVGSALPIVLLLATSLPVHAQSTSRAVFVSNNGNLEGSITAFTVNPDGTLNFVNRVVTGSRPSLNDPCPGCNAYEISLTPNGRYVATVHPAGSVDGITILDVGPTAALTQRLQFSYGANQGGPLDVQWIDDEYLAVARSELSPNQVTLYRFNPAVPSLTQVNSVPTASFTTYLAIHPSRQYLYAADSGSGRAIYVYEVGLNGALSLIDTEPTGSLYALEMAVSPDGSRLYSACGISGSGSNVLGFQINSGALSPLAASPFTSPGASPSNTWVSGDGKILVVGHGTDATARTFTIDSGTGAITSTGNFFDVGLQGTLGDVRTLDNFLFITDNSTATDGVMGIYSFSFDSATGALIQNGPITSTQGIAPRSLATWIPLPVTGDVNCDGVVNLADVPAFVLALLDASAYQAAYPNCNIQRADMNGDTFTNGDDVGPFVDAVIP